MTLCRCVSGNLVPSYSSSQSKKRQQDVTPRSVSYDALTASMFCGVRTLLTLPPFVLTVEPVSSKFFTHVLWHELTALYHFEESRISWEIHVGRQRSYRCSYKMNLRRKHAAHQTTTTFQTERYSRPRHLAASFPSPLRLKIEKRR